MELERDSFKLKRLISEMLVAVAQIENARVKSSWIENPEESQEFIKSKMFKNLAEYVIGSQSGEKV
jgi:hypothetical protein